MRRVGWMKRMSDREFSVEEVVDRQIRESPWSQQEEDVMGAIQEAEHIALSRRGERPENTSVSRVIMTTEESEKERREIEGHLFGEEWLNEAEDLPFTPWEGYVEGFDPRKKYLIIDEGACVGSIGPRGEYDFSRVPVGVEFKVWEKEE